MFCFWLAKSVMINGYTILQPLHGSQPCCGEDTCITQWSYEPCRAGLPRTDRSLYRVLTKRSQPEKWQPTPIFLPGEPHLQYERQNEMILEDEPPRLEGVQYPTGVEWRAITNSSRKNEAPGPKWKWHTVVAVSGGESKVWYSREQYCTVTRNVRSTVKVNWMWSRKRWPNRTLTSQE